MLIIFHEGKFNEFKKSKKKPSEFCKGNLGYRHVKSEEFIRDFFADVNNLIASIIEYKRKTQNRNEEYALADLLKKKEETI